MAGSVIFEEQLEVPLDLRSLAEFRRWAFSEDFPDRGRIDYIDGRIEVDMAPEEIFSRGSPKIEMIRVLATRVKQHGFGMLFSDRMRVSSREANLSAEPDVVFVSRESLDNGQVRLVPKASGEPGRYVELEGGPDLIVEIVSDSSVVKDLERLPASYFQSGVREYWLLDARGQHLQFVIHRRGDSQFEPVEVDADGYQRSESLGCSYRLEWDRAELGEVEFDLLEKAE